jgi:outer membrane protein assembly factor BamB
LPEKMRIQPTALIALAVATLLWPASAFAKRRAPSPVPPVVWQGVEYRAPLDVEHMGHVQAFELSSGRKLWETEVYHVWIMPLVETDVQWVFISAMQVQDGKLLIRNENGKSFKLDLKTGWIEGTMRYWVAWFFAGGLLLLAVLAWIRVRHGQQGAAPNRGSGKTGEQI